MGYRVRLDVAIFMSNGDCSNFNKGIFGGFVAKDYKQPLDLLKLSFPVTHPSMFRRIGFRFMETMPNSNSRYTNYGRPLENISNHKAWTTKLNEATNSTCIQLRHTTEAGYDAKKLLVNLGVLSDTDS
jgi:hypothetical protein